MFVEDPERFARDVNDFLRGTKNRKASIPHVR